MTASNDIPVHEKNNLRNMTTPSYRRKLFDPENISDDLGDVKDEPCTTGLYVVKLVGDIVRVGQLAPVARCFYRVAEIILLLLTSQ